MGVFMKPVKRLFLFAGFDKDNIVDDTVTYYVNALSKLGDVIFFADNDLPKSEIKKISTIPNVLYADGIRHKEYDFGSYKRGFLWARDKDILKKYEWLYFVNDSVYGPLNDLAPILNKLENSGSDLIGMVSECDDSTPLHVQSWFVGFNKKVFNCDFFENFMQKITHISSKTSLILKYEVGLSCIVMRHGFSMTTLINAKDNTIYENPRTMLVRGFPFVKKNAISKLRRLYFLYPYVDDDILIDYITAHMQRYNIQMVKDSFRDIYDLRLCGIPLLRISSKRRQHYKIYLFKYIRVLKIMKK